MKLKAYIRSITYLEKTNTKPGILGYFTTYEKCWLISISVLAIAFALIFPEEDTNGINGKLIMALYLVDTFANVLCELLISKQSKWNFAVSLFLVETSEILIYALLAYRFATMATTIFFWIPIDIISFINWHRHPDRDESSLTKVRNLSGTAEVLTIIGIVIWTIGVGSLLVYITDNITVTDLFNGNRSIEVICCYLDACVSALGVCNGIFILLRIKEQWIAWFIYSILEAVINILAGQYVLLVLKVGYLTNTVYGFIKWTQYIRNHRDEVEQDKRLM